MPITLGAVKSATLDTREWDRQCLAAIGRRVKIDTSALYPPQLTRDELRRLGFDVASNPESYKPERNW